VKSLKRSLLWSNGSWKLLLSALILVVISSGCSTTPSAPVVVEKMVLPPIPPILMMPCSALELAEDARLETLLFTHAANMERAHKCRSRHDSLVRRLNEFADGPPD